MYNHSLTSCPESGGKINLILRTLEEESGNQSSTARRLGTTAQNVSQFLKKNKNDEVKQ